MYKLSFNIIKRKTWYHNYQIHNLLCINSNASKFNFGTSLSSKLHQDYQNQIQDSIDWKFCQNFNDFCYFWLKNYKSSPQILNPNFSNFEDLIQKNKFSFKLITEKYDHINMMNKINELKLSFDINNKTHYKMMIFLIDSLNTDGQNFFALFSIDQDNPLILTFIKSLIEIGNYYSDLAKKDKAYNELNIKLSEIIWKSSFIKLGIDFAKEAFITYTINNLQNPPNFAFDNVKFRKIIEITNLLDEITLPQAKEKQKILVKESILEYIKSNINRISDLYELYNIIKIFQNDPSFNEMKPKLIEKISIILKNSEKYDNYSSLEDIINLLSYMHSFRNMKPIIWEEFKPHIEKLTSEKKIQKADEHDLYSVVEYLRAVLDFFGSSDKDAKFQEWIIGRAYNITKFQNLNQNSSYSAMLKYRIYNILIKFQINNFKCNTELKNYLNEDWSQKNLEMIFTKIAEAEISVLFRHFSTKLQNFLKQHLNPNPFKEIDLSKFSFKKQAYIIFYFSELVTIPKEFKEFTPEKQLVIEENFEIISKLLKLYDKLDVNFQSFIKAKLYKCLKQILENKSVEQQTEDLYHLILFKHEIFQKKNISNIVIEILKNIFSSKHTLRCYYYEQALFVMHALNLFEDNELIKLAHNVIDYNFLRFSNFQLATIFNFLALSKKLTQDQNERFQLALSSVIPELQLIGLSYCLYALPYIRINIHFKQALYDELMNRVIYPEYAGMICDHLFYECKTQSRKAHWINRYLFQLQNALKKDSSFVYTLQLARLLSQIGKFEIDMDVLLEIFKNKLNQQLDHENLAYNELSFVYSVVISYIGKQKIY